MRHYKLRPGELVLWISVTNLTLQDIADQLGLPRSTVAKWSTGERRIPEFELRTIVHTINRHIPPDHLECRVHYLSETWHDSQ